MKKVLILLSLCLSAMVPGLSAPPLKILHIGNSYTVDAAAMLPCIVSASGSTGTPFEVPQDTLCRKRRIAAINLGNELIGFRFLQEPIVHLRSLKQYYSGDPSVINKGLNITYADFQHYHTILSIGLKNGVIGKIRGMDAIAEIPGVYHVHQYRKVGDVMTRSGFIILQDLCRVYVEAPDTVELIKRIQKMLDLIQVENDKGENMLRDYPEGWQDYFKVKCNQ